MRIFKLIWLKFLCKTGRHDRVFWSDDRCEKDNIMTGIFRPYNCSRCGYESIPCLYPKFPMPKVKQPKKK